MGAVRGLAVLFGIVFIAAGVAGYLPMFTTDGMLLGTFEVDNMHNNVHIATGVIALLAALKGNYARLFFQIFGILYAIVTFLGFWRAGDLFMMHVNTADNVLHLVLAIVLLYIGFIFARRA